MWMRLHDLSMEYWGPAFLLDIAASVGEPLRIDEINFRKEPGTYARILVDVDFTAGGGTYSIGEIWEYENCPDFCSQYNSAGYMILG